MQRKLHFFALPRLTSDALPPHDVELLPSGEGTATRAMDQRVDDPASEAVLSMLHDGPLTARCRWCGDRHFFIVFIRGRDNCASYTWMDVQHCSGGGCASSASHDKARARNAAAPGLARPGICRHTPRPRATKEKSAVAAGRKSWVLNEGNVRVEMF